MSNTRTPGFVAGKEIWVPMPVLPSLYITLDLSFPLGLQLKGAVQMLFPLAEVPALAQPSPSSQKRAGKGHQEWWECSLWYTWRMPVRFSSLLFFLLRYTVLHSGHQELEKLPIHNDPESLESCFWLRTWLTTKPFIPIHVCMNRTPWHFSWSSSPPVRHGAMGPWGRGPREGMWVTGLDGTQGPSMEDLRAEKRLQVPSDAGSQPTQKRRPPLHPGGWSGSACKPPGTGAHSLLTQLLLLRRRFSYKEALSFVGTQICLCCSLHLGPSNWPPSSTESS